MENQKYTPISEAQHSHTASGFKQNKACPENSLYDSRFEHDNCGIGAVVNIKGIKTHQTVENALKIVENLEHRAGKDAEGKTGDGVGILLQISHKFFSKAVKPLGIKLGNERDYGIGMFFFPIQRTYLLSPSRLFSTFSRLTGLPSTSRDIMTLLNFFSQLSSV